MKIYCFSGLGADKRVFQFLNLHPHDLIHVDWIEPKEKESLSSYACRMGQVIDQNEPFALMGLSFGGMVVQEIAQVLSPSKVIVISSISNVKEKPYRMRMAKALHLYNYVPDKYFVKPSNIAMKLFGANTPVEKDLLADILKDGDTKFIRWALTAIGSWKNEKRVEAFRIHGDCDPLFPIKYVKPDYVVKGGSHLMVVSQSIEIQNQIINYIAQ